MAMCERRRISPCSKWRSMSRRLTFVPILLLLHWQMQPSEAFLHISGTKRSKLINELQKPATSHASYLQTFGENRQDDDMIKHTHRRQLPTPKDVADADALRRRYLLFSMLATFGASPILQASAAQAKDIIVGPNVEVLTPATLPTTNIFKPPTDNRDYLAYKLDNGLRVLLCSDPSSIEAAAAMDVHVGACSDPDTVKGLAHFNEHMLFLGTKDFPKEDSFEAFLAANGGRSNAYTDAENTVYYFDMVASVDGRVAEGLRRFGSVFATPLFTESATERELRAIDSENAKNLQSDTFRYFQMAKSRANRDHPFSKFFTGNKKTLLDDTRAQGIDLQQELVNFYQQYYSANQMTLAIAGPQSIEELQTMVQDAFASVPDRQSPKPEEAWKGIAPFTYGADSIVPSFYHIVEMVPVQDIRQISISWPVVYQDELERTSILFDKPSNYVAHLLGHEGSGSLLTYLKRQGWATSLATATEEQLSDFESFEIVVGLTRQGLNAVESVVGAIYSYLRLLRDRAIPDYVFDEVFRLDELYWRFSSKGNVGGYVQGLAASMQKYPAPLYIAGPRRLALTEYERWQLSGEPRPTFKSRVQLENTRMLVSRYLEALTVDNAIMTVISKDFEGKTTQQEVWYGTKYRARRIDDKMLENWRDAAPARTMQIDYPKPNRFIPSEAGLRVKLPVQKPINQKQTFEAKLRAPTAPWIIRDDDRWTVYFKPDEQFGQPKGYVIMELVTSDVFSTPAKAATGNLFELAVSDRLSEYAYDASLAGLVYEVKVLPRGVRLTFGGYSDKLRVFASYISKKLSKKVDDILPKTEAEFERYKDQILRALSAFDVKQPYAHASYYAQITLQPHRFQYDNSELLAATRRVTLSDLIEYSKNLWRSGKGEALIQGNFDEKEALSLVAGLDAAIPFQTIPNDEYPPRLTALPLPQSKESILPTRLVITESNPNNENSVCYVMLQSLGKTEKDHVMMELLSSILEQPFYDSLRTKQQLGYIVNSGLRGVGESRTLSFIVQSAVATADKLTLEIIRFLDAAESTLLEKLPKGDLAVYIKSLIDRKTEPDKDLIAEVTRNWSEISSGRRQFDRIQCEAAALLEIDKEELLKFWKAVYSGDGRRVLICEMIPQVGPASSEQPPASAGYSSKKLVTDGLLLGIDDVPAFRHDRERLQATDAPAVPLA
ncbi:hypothetical protein MPSEU_000211500 [Mayamaea pseudoterrestris]|nr:hypothetical protein MPSEU_000211500 [Mayamaea pseudoterrestris]